jgi:hypothetical protein
VLSASLTRNPSSISGSAFTGFVERENIRDRYDHEIFLGPDNNVAVFWKLVIVEEDNIADAYTNTTTSSNSLRALTLLLTPPVLYGCRCRQRLGLCISTRVPCRAPTLPCRNSDKSLQGHYATHGPTHADACTATGP